jgi:hypothetical protein
MFTIDSELFDDLLSLCDSLGIRGASEAEARRRESDVDEETLRTCAHEAGHALVHLLDGVRFGRVEVGGPTRGRLVSRPAAAEIPAVLCMPPIETRIATELAGAVAEEVIVGDVDPVGCWTDLRMALARAPDPGQARAQADRVRGMLNAHRHALSELANELGRTGVLTRAQCAAVVRAAGCPVDEPKFDPISPPDERARYEAARADVWAQKEARSDG